MAWPEISPIEWIRAKDVLPGESSHFTPWLAANLELLADAVGLADLTLVGVEVASYEKRLDILARGTNGDGEEIPVIIENQYGRTDHRHLGQVITYLAKEQHGLAVWIAEDFSEAHLAAVEFLNRTSIEGVGYLLLQVRFTHAANGYQVHFEVLSQPNAFIKSAAGKSASEPNLDKVEFVAAVLELIKSPLEQAGLGPIHMHSHGSFIKAGLPPSTGLASVRGHLKFRVTASDAEALLAIEAMPTGEENFAAIQVVQQRYAPLVEDALPSPVDQWKRGNGGARRAYASSTVASLGYQAGSVDGVAAWAQSMFLAWLQLLNSDPVPDIESAVADSISRA